MRGVLKPDRRTILTGLAAAGLAVAPLGSTARGAGALRIRRSIGGMRPDDPDLDALRRAIPILRRNGLWQAQVAVHADMRNRQHTSWRFLPWHRLLILHFEDMVARVSGKADFALPYWDWGRDPFPPIFYTDPAFIMPNRAAPPGMVMDSRWFTSKLDDPFAAYFGAPRDPGGQDGGPRYMAGSAEWSGHNLMHGFVGGDMNDLQRAPNDPVFYLHHANIDRSWALWRSRNPAEVYPQAWRDEVLAGLIDAEGRPAAAMTAGATVDPFALGYGYPQDTSLPPPFEPPSRPASSRRQRYALAARVVAPNAGVISIPADLADRPSVRAAGFIEIECDRDRSSMITISARRVSDGAQVFHDTIFAIPMGVCFEAQAYRINLDRVWGPAGTRGIELRLDITPMLGPDSGTSASVLTRAILDIDAPV